MARGEAVTGDFVILSGTNRALMCFPVVFKHEGCTMLQWILILLIVAAVAGLLGFGRLSGAALTGAKLLIAIVLILFLLAVLGIVAIA